MTNDHPLIREVLGAGELEALLLSSGALLHGHFRLSSGLHSTAYVQCALLLEEPRRARRVARSLAGELVRRLSLEPASVDSVMSPALGGIVIGHEVAEALGVPFRFAERQGEAMVLRRGFSLRAGERVAIVEDVVTTGRSTRECAAVAHEHGGRVVGYAAILDRSGEEQVLERALVSLLRLDLPTFSPQACPACEAGRPLEKPGSRPVPAA